MKIFLTLFKKKKQSSLRKTRKFASTTLIDPLSFLLAYRHAPQQLIGIFDDLLAGNLP